MTQEATRDTLLDGIISEAGPALWTLQQHHDLVTRRRVLAELHHRLVRNPSVQKLLLELAPGHETDAAYAAQLHRWRRVLDKKANAAIDSGKLPGKEEGFPRKPGKAKGGGTAAGEGPGAGSDASGGTAHAGDTESTSSEEEARARSPPHSSHEEAAPAAPTGHAYSEKEHSQAKAVVEAAAACDKTVEEYLGKCPGSASDRVAKLANNLQPGSGSATRNGSSSSSDGSDPHQQAQQSRVTFVSLSDSEIDSEVAAVASSKSPRSAAFPPPDHSQQETERSLNSRSDRSPLGMRPGGSESMSVNDTTLADFDSPAAAPPPATKLHEPRAGKRLLVYMDHPPTGAKRRAWPAHR
jgi:hypothetical protein